MKVAVFVGTRPEIIKMQPIIKELQSRKNVDLLFVHTGQHYDGNMSGDFIEEFDLPCPDKFLNIGLFSRLKQVGKAATGSQVPLKFFKPDVVLVLGDTNSALGVALAAADLNLPLGHVEAGCRCFDRTMVEEQNRVLIADLASLDFAPTSNCVTNLCREGIPDEIVFLTGHPIVDLLQKAKKAIDDHAILKYGLHRNNYYFLTLHRQENVDDTARLEKILKAVHSLSQSNTIILPLHPRTKKNMMGNFKLSAYLRAKCIVTEPLGYMETLALIRNASLVMTDSGGVQQEAALLGVPCVTLRTCTEWIETVEAAVNFRAGFETEEILSTVSRVVAHRENILENLKEAHFLFGKPPVAKKIVDIIQKEYG